MRRGAEPRSRVTLERGAAERPGAPAAERRAGATMRRGAEPRSRATLERGAAERPGAPAAERRAGAIMTTRRAFLAGCLAAALWPRRARAIGPASQFRFGELTIGGLPQPGPPRPLSLTRLGTQIDLRTSIDVARVASAPVQLHSPKLFETPFLYMAADRRFPIPPARDLEALRRFLTFGGFLVIDSAEGRAGGGLDASVRQLVAAVFLPAPGLAPRSA